VHTAPPAGERLAESGLLAQSVAGHLAVFACPHENDNDGGDMSSDQDTPCADQETIDELEPLDLGKVTDTTHGSNLGVNFDGGGRWG